MVDWLSASAYSKVGYSYFQPTGVLTQSDQDDYAHYLYNLYPDISHQSSECRMAMKRFFCSQVFPECAEVGKSVSSVNYLPTCSSQCLQMKSCTFKFDCPKELPADNCMALVSPGFFILNQDVGSFEELPTLYGTKLCWVFGCS